CQQYDSDPFSF
nr:immunoglobulin light chain junction region [Macaca mulatta]MOV82221.1 immunoglobulin light chain junction region [Macaca mulatta]MOV85493.1 immunoglobulin light chain junction region [Macaca mulatta]MOV85767.1 immunoglobulin light chain junction region [Macaca mulatta]